LKVSGEGIAKAYNCFCAITTMATGLWQLVNYRHRAWELYSVGYRNSEKKLFTTIPSSGGLRDKAKEGKLPDNDEETNCLYDTACATMTRMVTNVDPYGLELLWATLLEILIIRGLGYYTAVGGSALVEARLVGDERDVFNYNSRTWGGGKQ
jgi:hypothetical protein